MRSRVKKDAILIATCLGILFGHPLFGQEAGKTSGAKSQSGSPQAFVQVTAVAAETSTIRLGADTATIITAQILLSGPRIPSDRNVKVEVSTYYTDPPNNELLYEGQAQTIGLHEGVTVVKFHAHATAHTFVGKIRVAVTVEQVPNGIHVKDPEPEEYTTDLTIIGP
jgi:hypothetical protein